jgi:hypothetical protein
MRVLGSPVLTKFLTEDIEKLVGGKFTFEDDPVQAARLMMAHMDRKRIALKLRPLMYSKSFLSAEEASATSDGGAPTPVQGDAPAAGGIRRGCSGHAIAVDGVPGEKH